jgi:hypothetical protein
MNEIRPGLAMDTREPFMFLHRVLNENVIEIKDGMDSLLEVLRHFIDMTADITTTEDRDGVHTDIKIIIQIKGVK